jgi:putative ABC transport system substrate-binding protein
MTQSGHSTPFHDAGLSQYDLASLGAKMRRRDFIKVVAGSASWALTADAQERVAHVGALMVVAETDPDSQRLASALETGLAAAGWHKGRNLDLIYRWGASNVDLLSRYAEELVRAAPDILLAFGTPALISLHKATTTIPIVFAGVSDPVGQGFVANMSHPGGNLTGFSNFDPDIGSKWLQLLKDVAPSLTHVTIMFNPRTSPYNVALMQAIKQVAPGFQVSVSQASVLSDEDIRNAITRLGTTLGSGLVVPSDPFTYGRTVMVAALAVSNKIPAVYAFPPFAHDGGLIAYGVDLADQLRNAGGYVARILKGDNPANLPIQAPTRYTLVINLKTAKTLGLDIPSPLLVRADEVIE